MNAGQFAKRRARIEGEHGRRRGYASKAMEALVREAGAALIIAHGKVVAWRMPNGQVVCRKRRYTSQDAAEYALGLVHAGPHARYVPERAYLCPYCAGWHLTSQSAITQ